MCDVPVVDVDALRREIDVANRLTRIETERADLGCAAVSVLNDMLGFDFDVWHSVVTRVSTRMGVSTGVVEDFLVEHCDVAPEIFSKEFDVTLTIPMVVTVRVVARDEDDAHDHAYDVINDAWPRDLVDSYDFDLDCSGASIEYVEEA